MNEKKERLADLTVLRAIAETKLRAITQEQHSLIQELAKGVDDERRTGEGEVEDKEPTPEN